MRYQTHIELTDQYGRKIQALFSNDVDGKIRIIIGKADLLCNAEEMKQMILKFTSKD